MDKSGLMTFTSHRRSTIYCGKTSWQPRVKWCASKQITARFFFFYSWYNALYLRGRLVTYGKKYLAFFNFLTLLNPRDYYICTLCKFRIPLIFRDFLLGCCKITPVWFSTMRIGSFNGFCVAMVSIGNDQISVYSFENNKLLLKEKIVKSK